MTESESGGRRDSLGPLQIPIFRRFWISSMASNFGGLIQTVAAAWMMTALTGDARMVALVQTCATAPMMLISLPAGAFADIYERRLIMLIAQTGMLAVAAALAVLTAMHLTTPPILLAATFLIGAGTALNAPAWQASMQDQVPREAVEAAASLNSVGFNVARSLGPAIGGFIVALWGPASAFALNAVSYVGLIATLLAWKGPPRERLLPPERVGQAIAAGMRFVALSPSLVATMVRGGAFGFCGSSVWALTAVLAHDALGGGPSVFGLLLGGFGFGAVVGAFVRAAIPIDRERLTRICSLVFGISAILLGISGHIILSVPLMVLAGAAWVMTLTGLSVTVQFVAPRWVVGRAIALNQVSIFFGMASGSWLWGLVAHHWSVQVAFIASGAAMLASLLLAFVFPLASGEIPDLTPTRTRPVDHLNGPVGPNDGPITVTVEYRVRPENFRAFVAAMEELGRIRRRNGAHRWTLHQDIDDPTRWVERFHSLTWIDHLRRQTRHTRADQEVSDRVRALHEGEVKVARVVERRISTRPIAALDAARDQSE
ncbi:MAG TPA: MFS transporter [Allosphingosinicella sp.]|jgi:MFS family permease|nr:MFS transporter [Allosphingosinicella sp.]